MSAYDELICIIREQGAVYNQEGPALAVMTGPDSCEIGAFKLSREDLYIAEHLLKTVATKVNVPESHQDASTYIQPLQAGGIVLVQKVTETAYVVIERVVGP